MREYICYPGGFRPLALLTQDAGEKQSWHYHCDPNGAPVRLTSLAGEIVWSEKTGVWGEKGPVHASRIDNPLRFQGQYFDAETGLHYNRYRYYDPAIAGYISQDPIGLAGGLNVYAYGPNPLSWVDPWGLDIVRVYHYTSREGYNGIIGSGVINMSDPGKRSRGAISGKPKAVYVTMMTPEQLDSSRARGQMGLTNDKISHYVSFEIDSDKVKRIDRQDGVKRLYIHENIQLRDAGNKLRHDIEHGNATCKN